MTDSYLFLAAAGAIALAALPASAAQQGQATGTVDGQSLDVALDCSNWGAQQYPSLAAADKNVLLEGTLFPDGRFALTWKPADYRYQLLFDDVGHPLCQASCRLHLVEL